MAFTRKQTRKQKKQKGGYYVSVYHGIQNAGILLPLVFRQGYQLWNTTRKKKKTRGHSLKDRKTPGYR
jgi:hypothetical protein